MSPFSAHYSSLDEVWGDGFSVANKKSKKSSASKRYQKDPVCELYELGGSASKAYTENDIMEYVNSAGATDNYSKVDFMNKMSIKSREAEELPPQIEETEIVKVPKPYVPKRVEEDDVLEFMGYMDKASKPITSSSIPLADLSLYVISGIILIFMMEQFVKVGMTLKGF